MNSFEEHPTIKRILDAFQLDVEKGVDMLSNWFATDGSCKTKDPEILAQAMREVLYVLTGGQQGDRPIKND